jgi:homocysteine S-methyltransferase
LVAASIGPFGATQCNSGEYTGAYGEVTEKQLISFHLERWRVLAESEADVIACETIPSMLEVRALLKLLSATPERWAWMSFMCRDAKHLADGTPLREALLATQDAPNVCAVGVNCLPPSMVTPVLETLVHYATAPIIVYPNASETWLSHDRKPGAEIGPEGLVRQAKLWEQAGAHVIGGCCRTRPAHIRALSLGANGG